MVGGLTVTDLHVHVAPGTMLRPEAAALLEDDRFAHSPDEFLRFLDANRVERAALISYVAPEVMGYPDAINPWTAAYCEADPDRLIAFGSVHPRLADDPAEATERILDHGIRGLKIHPPHQLFPVNAYRVGGAGEGIAEVYRVAQERRVPVMVDTGTSVFPGARNVFADPLPIDDVAVDFPDLPLILAHAGRPLWGETALFLARRHPNVWLDVSGIPPKKLLTFLPRLPEIADKCLWGSDWPGPGVRDPRKNVEDFLALGLPERTNRAILDGNSRKLFP